MSGAEPWVACAMACRSPTHRPGAKPSPPTSPAPISVKMSPNWLVVTTTSNCCGAVTSFSAMESIITSSKLTSGYSRATLRHSSANMPQASR